eukprot:Seg2402.2 transcript_id=Seg2402.2/GoldUCD/mRNA.D3Y31 product="hypothetical protein" protein_id=Seg2402.2/GoldUCD/D3Y31
MKNAKCGMRIQKVVLTNRNGSSSPSGDGILSSSDARRLASAQATPLSIQDALSQITTIQSTLEGVVQTLRDVETLKETVTTWTDENLRLKEENELLKKKLQQQEKGNERKESS